MQALGQGAEAIPCLGPLGGQLPTGYVHLWKWWAAPTTSAESGRDREGGGDAPWEEGSLSLEALWSLSVRTKSKYNLVFPRGHAATLKGHHCTGSTYNCFLHAHTSVHLTRD